ncbi:hypothetical protein [Amycolatopsis sp. YIM 10]|uniref:hypothetical protein n=1 Tax=Amycolatopsis sp. YIM 10 TaxID=2653857 RepID=UPI00128FE9A8|nr:hypothetical protein [Amycolatopsis sp. YIM 10]QFU87806.1 hypothetical protein YIM_13100 [Amycolatopsis sp. YIM 10]
MALRNGSEVAAVASGSESRRNTYFGGDLLRPAFDVLEFGRMAVGADVAGVSAPPEGAVANQWHVYFSVADITAAVDLAPSLGGAVVMGPFDTPVGRMAKLRALGA